MFRDLGRIRWRGLQPIKLVTWALNVESSFKRACRLSNFHF